MTAVAAIKQTSIEIERADLTAPIFTTTGRTEIAIRAGTVIRVDGQTHAFETNTPVALGEMIAGSDYGVGIDNDGRAYAVFLGPVNPLEAGCIGGFHFAANGCAAARSGGDGIPAINPHSAWDVGFRFVGRDPRGMALVDMGGDRRFWADIYLLGTEHHTHGTSWCGATIADGDDLPMKLDGKGRYHKLDYATAVEIYGHHGKRLLGAEEFFAAAFGVEERCSRPDEPDITGATVDQAERFISRFGLVDVTGTMWQWGTDGDPDNPRPSIFGGSWLNGSVAGSRFAYLDYWGGSSSLSISARGAGDHLGPA